MKIAIVSTVRNAQEMMPSFLHYHTSIGIHHFYIFLDDPQDLSVDLLDKYPNVTTMVHNSQLQRLWQLSDFYRKYKKQLLFSDLMSRQQLNVAIAIQLARKQGIDWLLHIDHDELLYSPQLFQPGNQGIAVYFQRLEKKGIYNVNFRNCEAVVESAEVRNPFLEVSLFKVNPLTLPAERFSAEQITLIKSVPQIPERFFFSYVNGKSATNVNCNPVPDGVHDFFLPEQQGKLAYWQRRLAQNQIMKRWGNRYPLFERLGKWLLSAQNRRLYYSTDPIILHYPHCSFDEFWTKYKTYQHYHAMKDERMFDRLSRFHAEADAVVNSGDKSAVQDFYNRRVVLDKVAIADRLLSAGICQRIREPSELLNRSLFLRLSNDG